MELTFSISGVFKFMLIAVLIFSFFRLFSYFFPVLFSNERIKQKLKKNLPFIEFVAWIVYTVWTFKVFLKDNQYFAFALFFLILAISIWAGITFLKDYIAGIIIKAGNELNIDDHIKFSNYSGKIKRLNFRTLELLSEEGQLIYIPYSKLIKGEIIKTDQPLKNAGYTFRIDIFDAEDPGTIKEKVFETIVYSPWASLKKDPTIKLTDSKENHHSFDITVYAINDEMCEKIEHLIKQKYSDQ